MGDGIYSTYLTLGTGIYYDPPLDFLNASISRAGPTTAFGRVVGRQAYTAAMGIAAPIELQRSSGFIITQLAVDVR